MIDFFLNHSIEIMGIGYAIYAFFMFVDKNFLIHRQTLTPEEFIQLWVDLQWWKKKRGL
jgi:hypothetical protein